MFSSKTYPTVWKEWRPLFPLIHCSDFGWNPDRMVRPGRKKQNNVFWSIFQWWMFPLPRGINSENADAASTIPVSTVCSSLRLSFIWNLVPLEFQKDNSTPPKCQLHLAPHRYHPTSSPLPQICHIFCPTSRVRWAVFIQWSIMKFVGVSLVCRQQINSKPNSSIPFSIATVWCCDLKLFDPIWLSNPTSSLYEV